MPMLAVAGTMQLPQRALKILNLALVIDLLPLGQFQRFQHFLHFIERMFQLLDDPVHLLNGIRDCGRAMRRLGLARLLRFLTFAAILTRCALFTWSALSAFLMTLTFLVLFHFLHRRRR